MGPKKKKRIEKKEGNANDAEELEKLGIFSDDEEYDEEYYEKESWRD